MVYDSALVGRVVSFLCAILNPMNAYRDSETLFELVVRVLCDTAPKGGRADAVYLYAQTRDDEASVLAAGEFLWRLGRVKYVVCNSRLKAGFGYPGFIRWKKKLVAAKVPENRILPMQISADFPPSTDAEARGLIRFAKRNKIKTLYIAAPPLHQLRAFVSTVSALKHERANIALYNFTGFSQRWEERIVHSQGIQRGTRSHLLHKELAKIEKYLKQGTLVSPHTILEYMNKRDRKKN